MEEFDCHRIPARQINSYRHVNNIMRASVKASRISFCPAMLIGYAFRISPDRVTGPEWDDGRRVAAIDVVAKILQGASELQVPEMFQALPADRLKLAFHRGSKTGALYALVVEKSGLKLKESVPDEDIQFPAMAIETGASPSMDRFFGAVQTPTIANADGRTYFQPAHGERATDR